MSLDVFKSGYAGSAQDDGSDCVCYEENTQNLMSGVEFVDHTTAKTCDCEAAQCTTNCATGADRKILGYTAGQNGGPKCNCDTTGDFYYDLGNSCMIYLYIYFFKNTYS